MHENIRAYYYDHFDQLDTDKQFHFATRLAAWQDDPVARGYLHRLKSAFVPEPYNEEAIRTVLAQLLTNPPAASINAAHLRAAFFAKYPLLRGIDFALFRVRHLLAVYDIDARPALLQLVPYPQLEALKNDILADPQAIRMLSTYAINYIYLVDKILFEGKASVDLQALYALGEGYDLSNPQHVQLFIYLYTHCLIGETNFYTRKISAALLPIYKQMILALERVIEKYFEHINLDNKLEFLVCCRIVNYQSLLFERVYDECKKSVSDEGYFLVDRHNTHAQSNKVTLSASEHRNVLLIMSGSKYVPHATVV